MSSAVVIVTTVIVGAVIFAIVMVTEITVGALLVACGHGDSSHCGSCNNHCDSSKFIVNDDSIMVDYISIFGVCISSVL